MWRAAWKMPAGRCSTTARRRRRPAVRARGKGVGVSLFEASQLPRPCVEISVTTGRQSVRNCALRCHVVSKRGREQGDREECEGGAVAMGMAVGMEMLKAKNEQEAKDKDVKPAASSPSERPTGESNSTSRTASRPPVNRDVARTDGDARLLSSLPVNSQRPHLWILRLRAA